MALLQRRQRVRRGRRAVAGPAARVGVARLGTAAGRRAADRARRLRQLGGPGRVRAHAARRQLAERGVDQRARVVQRPVQLADQVQRRVGGKVPVAPELQQRLAAPARDLLHLADREAAAERVLLVQELQQLAVHAVLNRVHHLRLGHHRAPLLLDAPREELRRERDLGQRLQHLRAPRRRSRRRLGRCLGRRAAGSTSWAALSAGLPGRCRHPVTSATILA